MNDFGTILAQAQPHPEFDWLLQSQIAKSWLFPVFGASAIYV